MNLAKDARYILKQRTELSKVPSKPKQHTLPTEKENIASDSSKKDKNRLSKNATANMVTLKRDTENNADIAEYASRKKYRAQQSNMQKGLSTSLKGKQDFSLTGGLKRDDKKEFFVTSDVTSAIKTINKQMKMNTMLGSKEKNETAMTEDDINRLFDNCGVPNSRPKLSGRSSKMDQIKRLLETEHQAFVTRKHTACIKDYADSIKYLDLEEGGDKLLSALDDTNMIKIQPQKDIDKTAKFKELFVVGKQIGEGAYASVRVAIYSSLNKKIAIKIYQKKKIREPQRKRSVRREIKLLQHVNHRNIVKIYDVIETNNHINLIMEYIPGVSLSSFLKNQPEGRLQEKQARSIFHGLAEAVVYLHSINICHRDIKMENVLLDCQLSPKLIDFGFATCIDNSKKVKMFCGTPSFMAPEIVSKQQYRGTTADIWALGVLLFVLVTGIFPFKGITDKELYSKICSGEYPNIQHLSESVQDLISKMLCVDGEQRISGREILRHQWLTRPLPMAHEIRPATVLQERNFGTHESFRTKTETSKDKRVFLNTEPNQNIQQLLRKATGRDSAAHTRDSPSPSPNYFRMVEKVERVEKGEREKIEKPSSPSPGKETYPLPRETLIKLSNKIYF